jgi:hypothetical protein
VARLVTKALIVSAATLVLTGTGWPADPTHAARMSPGARARDAAEYNLKGAPVASFAWFPIPPSAGSPVTLVSTSVDRASPITEWAWDISDNSSFGAFVPGGPATTATFSTPGEHVLRLRVTNASHLSSVVAQTIQMRKPPAGVMFPFPTIRISGTIRRGGVKLTRVSVSAPARSRIHVRCRGRRCPVRVTTDVAAGLRPGAVITKLRLLERFIPSGATLQFRVSREREIGAYTRFTVRHRGAPVRVDSCLDPAGAQPMKCPS